MSNKGRKAYGGYALNAAILAVSPQDAIYDAASPPPDVEFYSPDPVGDVVDICKRLHAEGHEYVQGKEAVHDGTWTRWGHSRLTVAPITELAGRTVAVVVRQDAVVDFGARRPR